MTLRGSNFYPQASNPLCLCCHLAPAMLLENKPLKIPPFLYSPCLEIQKATDLGTQPTPVSPTLHRVTSVFICLVLSKIFCHKSRT